MTENTASNPRSAPTLKRDVALVRRALREYAKVRQYDINPNVRASRWAPMRAFERIFNEVVVQDGG